MGLLSDLAGTPRTGSVPVRGRDVTVRALSNGALAELAAAHECLKPLVYDLDLQALGRCPAAAVAALLAAALDTTEGDAEAAHLTAYEERLIVREMLDLSFGAPDAAAPGEPEGPGAAASPENAPGPLSSPAAGGSDSIPSR